MSNKGGLPSATPAPTSQSQTVKAQEQVAYAELVPQLQQLSQSAKTLNNLSDDLTTAVADIERILNKLNLGIRAATEVETLEQDAGGAYCHWLNLVYGKRSGKWGFIIEELEQNWNDPSQDSYECWLFKEAPRDFRLKVVDKIPALLDAMVKQSQETAVEITKKTDFAKRFADALLKSSPDGSKK